MALSEQERERVKYHLGYPSTSAAQSLNLGIPQAFQWAFLVEGSMDRLLPVGEPRVRALLGTLDDIEAKLSSTAQDVLLAEKVGGISTRGDAPEKLECEYHRWACRLADQLGTGLYPYAERFAKYQRGGGGINIAVMR